MQEELISFETAKLAKEKGFKELCFNYYNLRQELQEPYLENGSSTDVDFRVDLEDLLEQYNGPYHNTYSAPSQSLLQKWLREVHNIYVNSYHDLSSNGTKIRYYTSWGFIGSKDKSDNYNSNGWFDEHGDYLCYEEAMEFGLQEALKLIK